MGVLATRCRVDRWTPLLATIRFLVGRVGVLNTRLRGGGVRLGCAGEDRFSLGHTRSTL